jgi:tripartite-type tricarboxylate transporter receptor subunit TctC
MMDRRTLFVIGLAITIILVSSTGFAASFYEGKTIRLTVGTSAGGGFDTYARVLSRHLGKYIPGNPKIIVENMPGGGGLIAANYLYRVAKPDGLAIAHFNGTLFFEQVLGTEGVEFDSKRFEYIGTMMKGSGVVVLTKASGITSLDKWQASKAPVKLGGVGPGNFATDNVPKILKECAGLPIQLISGYSGTAEIRLAAEGGEVAGCCFGWDVIKSTWGKGLETGAIVPVLQVSPRPLADLPKVPLAISLAKTDEARKMIEVGLHSNLTITRPFVLPPGTPKDRVQLLRKAFEETLKDKDLLAEAGKARLEIDPVSGDELQKTIAGLANQDPALLKKIKVILAK